MTSFGIYVRKHREKRLEKDPRYSLRQLAARVELEPAYLSKIERGEMAPPSEDAVNRIAAALEQDPDVLLAMAGKVSKDLLEIIRKRPKLFAQLIRELKKAPDHAVLRIVRDVRDGEW